VPDRRKQKTGKKPQNRARKWLGITGSTLLVSAALWIGASFVTDHPLWPVSNTLQAGKAAHSKSFESTPGRFTALLIGTDLRPQDNIGNADVIVVASIDERNNRVELMSVPRDTQVPFPDGKYHKINESLHVGGPDLTMSLVENLLGMPIDHYALTHFDGLVNMIDTIHGIHINVPKRMYYLTGDKKYGIIHLHKGEQTLNGEQALAFVRYRKDTLGDIGRTERQQMFLTALAKKLSNPASIRYLPSIAKQLWNSVDTDISISDLPRIIRETNKMRSYSVIHETLPGSFHDPVPGDLMDLSYWVVNPVQARYVARQFFCSGVVQNNPVQDPETTQSWAPPTKHGSPALQEE
jgi:polyisoprenyl-teichoic acid--peptidoglycan teichoic acid transferase